MHQGLSGRVAIVTGATAGIGEAIARAVVEQGASCVVNARRAERLDQLARELGRERCVPVAGDCADEAVIARLLEAGERLAGGRAACLVVINAGRGLSGGVLGSDPAQWEEMIRTNILSAARLLRAAGNRLARETEGRSGAGVLDRARDIIVLGSVVGRHVSPFSGMYGGTKFAVHGLTEAARRELAGKGVRVTLIEPGFVVSEFQGVAGYDPKWFEEVRQRIGPPLTPADVARAVVFAASQPAAVHVSDVVIRPTRQDYP